MRVDSDTDVPTMPTLNKNIHLLETDQRATEVLQSLVLDHLLLNDGHALWIDSHGNATTQPLARVAPSKRVLDRIQVARGFTAYQHYSLVETLPRHCSAGTTLIVLPELDWLYRQEDPRRGRARELLATVVTMIQDIADRVDVSVLLTRTAADGLSQSVDEIKPEIIRCEQTKFGPRFVGDEFEMLVYRTNGYIQTTLAFWERVLTERHGASQNHQPGHAHAEVTSDGAY